MNIKKLIRPCLKQFKPYVPSSTVEQVSEEINIDANKIIKLDTGENPYLESMQDKECLKKIKLFLYPDPLSTKLRKKLSIYTGYNPDYIVCGNGSDELIDLIIRAFVNPKDEVIISPPTFPMYEFFTQLADGITIKILRSEKNNFSINVENIVKAINKKTKLIFIDSPGNPTGVVVNNKEIISLLKQECVIVVDEAYFEYCGQSAIKLVKKYPNLIVLRTFSKWCGLASLRIGYAIANPAIINIINSIKPPYNINAAAQAMACSILDNRSKLQKKLSQVIKYRQELIERLNEVLNLMAYPSQGAYVLIKPKVSALKIQSFLKKKGIIVKVKKLPIIGECIRMNIGIQQEMEKVVTELSKYLLTTIRDKGLPNYEKN